jgi:hypothetical protein
MAGAFDRESFPLASIKASPTNSIEKAFNSAMANMDKVLANPKATTKQITTAMDKLNVATDKYAQSVLKTIGSSGTTEIPNPINPPSQGFDFGGSSLKATPPAPITPITYTPPAPPVKTATPDIVLFNDETVPIEVMEDLLFENIGGQELINMDEITALLEEQKVVQEQSQKLLEQTPVIQIGK